jgi:hypothetical protein
MPGGGLVLYILAPLALLGLLVMIQLRFALARHGYRRLVPSRRSSGRLLKHAPWRSAAIAAGNIVVPLLASLHGLAALASEFGLPVISYVLHGINVAQGLLGLALVARLLSQPDLFQASFKRWRAPRRHPPAAPRR